MTPQEFVKVALTGREYGWKLSEEEKALAKKHDIVIAYGDSDDLLEFRGAIEDEASAIDGGTAHIVNGKLYEAPDDDEVETLQKFGVDIDKQLQSAITVNAEWCPKDLDCSWRISVNREHATFDVMEDGELFCRGVVFKLANGKPCA